MVFSRRFRVLEVAADAVDFRISTPTGLDNKAQGRERSERTLGRRTEQYTNPEGDAQPEIGREISIRRLLNPYRVRFILEIHFPRVARQSR